MRTAILALIGIGVCVLSPVSEPFIPAAHEQDIDWQTVDETLGRTPAVSDDVHRYGFPRTDLPPPRWPSLTSRGSRRPSILHAE